jgi:hypothetical protein
MPALAVSPHSRLDGDEGLLGGEATTSTPNIDQDLRSSSFPAATSGGSSAAIDLAASTYVAADISLAQAPQIAS